jgi:cytochrome c oxidase subunit 3
MELKVGKIEELEAELPQKKRPSRKYSGGNSPGNNNGGGGGGGGGGDDRSDDDKSSEKVFKSEKYRVGMGLILLVVLMTFGALIGTYVVLATNQALEWKPFNLPVQVWISTVIIIVSSMFFEKAKNNLWQNEQKGARKWFVATSVIGMIFIASQILAWLSLVNRGVYATGNSYAGLFYILTAVHAVHVFGGIVSLVFIVLKTQMVTLDEGELLKRQWFARVIAWYWHFIGVLWIVLFLLLGFYK